MTNENATDKPSVCPLDCPDTCSLQITVNDGIISKVRGSRVNPYTAGAICDKVTKYYPEFVHGALRLRSPLRRTGAAGSNEFAAISWDEALSLIAERTQQAIEEYGPQTVLPAASHFEFDDIYTAYGHAYLQRAEPVIPVVGESLPNTEIFRRLAQAFGFTDAMFNDSDHELMDAALDADDTRLQGYRPSQIPLDRALLMTTAEQQELIMCATVTPDTDSGRIELFSQDLEDRFGYGVPRYEALARSGSFSIITPSSSKRTNATFGGDSASADAEIVEINPADAAAGGIETDSLVEVVNQRGRVVLRARVTDAVAPGVLYSPKGTWLASSASGQTVNALIDAELKTDIVDGACYNETFVDVYRMAPQGEG